MICGQFSLMGKYDVVVNQSKEKDSIPHSNSGT